MFLSKANLILSPKYFSLRQNHSLHHKYDSHTLFNSFKCFSPPRQTAKTKPNPLTKIFLIHQDNPRPKNNILETVNSIPTHFSHSLKSNQIQPTRSKLYGYLIIHTLRCVAQLNWCFRKWKKKQVYTNRPIPFKQW